jgi:hypothetical protein
VTPSPVHFSSSGVRHVSSRRASSSVRTGRVVRGDARFVAREGVLLPRCGGALPPDRGGAGPSLAGGLGGSTNRLGGRHRPRSEDRSEVAAAEVGARVAAQVLAGARAVHEVEVELIVVVAEHEHEPSAAQELDLADHAQDADTVELDVLARDPHAERIAAMPLPQIVGGSLERLDVVGSRGRRCPRSLRM